jgi:hypothetical protein
MNKNWISGKVLILVNEWNGAPHGGYDRNYSRETGFFIWAVEFSKKKQ